jgi:hypothetical protein
MNEVRVKKLAAEGKVEFTKKIFKRFLRQHLLVADILGELAQSSVKDEDVFSSPDFTFTLGTKDPAGKRDYVCVQATDGKALRIVGYMKQKSKKTKVK